MTSKNFADSGRTKLDVKREITGLATRSVRDMKHRRVSFPESHALHRSHLADAGDDDARAPFVRDAEDIVIVTTGGWGSNGGISSVPRLGRLRRLHGEQAHRLAARVKSILFDEPITTRRS